MRECECAGSVYAYRKLAHATTWIYVTALAISSHTMHELRLSEQKHESR